MALPIHHRVSAEASNERLFLPAIPPGSLLLSARILHSPHPIALAILELGGLPGFGKGRAVEVELRVAISVCPSPPPSIVGK